jgi:hypothetical protein
MSPCSVSAVGAGWTYGTTSQEQDVCGVRNLRPLKTSRAKQIECEKEKMLVDDDDFDSFQSY